MSLLLWPQSHNHPLATAFWMVGWPASATAYGCVSFRNFFFVLKPLFLYIQVTATSILSWLGLLIVPLLFLWQGLSVCPWQAWHLLCRPSWPWLRRDPTCFCLPSSGINGLLDRACLMYPFPVLSFSFLCVFKLKTRFSWTVCCWLPWILFCCVLVV